MQFHIYVSPQGRYTLNNILNEIGLCQYICYRRILKILYLKKIRLFTFFKAVLKLLSFKNAAFGDYQDRTI